MLHQCQVQKDLFVYDSLMLIHADYLMIIGHIYSTCLDAHKYLCFKGIYTCNVLVEVLYLIEWCSTYCQIVLSHVHAALPSHPHHFQW